MRLLEKRCRDFWEIECKVVLYSYFNTSTTEHEIVFKDKFTIYK